MCSPSEPRFYESLAVQIQWLFLHAYAVLIFLQTGKANRDVYVQPSFESSTRPMHLWFPEAAVDDNLNSGTIWKTMSDKVLLKSRLSSSKHIPELFFI